MKIWGILVSFGCRHSCSSARRVSNFNSKVPQGSIYPYIQFERDRLNIFLVRVFTLSGSTGGRRGDAKTIISPDSMSCLDLHSCARIVTLHEDGYPASRIPEGSSDYEVRNINFQSRTAISVSDALVGNMILFGKRVFSVSSGFSFGKGINLFSCGFSEHITTVNFVIGFSRNIVPCFRPVLNIIVVCFYTFVVIYIMRWSSRLVDILIVNH